MSRSKLQLWLALIFYAVFGCIGIFAMVTFPRTYILVHNTGASHWWGFPFLQVWIGLCLLGFIIPACENLFICLGQYDRAERLLKRYLAVKNKIKLPAQQTKLSLITLYYLQGKYAEAEADLRTMVASGSRGINQFVVRGLLVRTLIAEEKYQEAEAILKELVAWRGKNLVVSFLKYISTGWVNDVYIELLNKMNRQDEAKQLERSMRTLPTSLRSGLRFLRIVLLIPYTFVMVFMLYLLVLFFIKLFYPSPLDLYIQEAHWYKERQQYDRAVNVLDRAARTMPRSGEIYYQRSKIYFLQKKPELAIADINKSIDLNNSDSFNMEDYLEIRAAYYISLGQWQNVINDFSKVIKLDPKSTFSYCHRARAYLLQKQYQNAIDDCNKDIASDPKDAETYAVRSAAYAGLGETQKASDDCNKAIELDPKLVEGYRTRAEACAKLVDDLAKKDQKYIYSLFVH